MNKTALFTGLLYSFTAIVFKLVILLGGFTLTKFGFYYSNIISVFLMIPFLFLAIYLVRKKEPAGNIRGREAMRVAMTVVAVGAVMLSVYNYAAFNWKYKDIATEYYNSAEYTRILNETLIKNPGKMKAADIPVIVQEQIASLSAGRDTTAKLFPLLIIGLTGSFFASLLMKKNT
ncbi:MAG TPA: DUF4199 domain-containing protein [Bacteroidia bacterium]|nr:DUF4199 domain-containing protein [Bacteroidia bacterium]